MLQFSMWNYGIDAAHEQCSIAIVSVIIKEVA